PASALAIDATVLALAAPPEWAIGLVSSQTRIVLAEGGLRATPRALGEARAGFLDQPLAALADAAAVSSRARAARRGSIRACLAPGARRVIEARRAEPPAGPGPARHERAAVLLGRRADGTGVDLALEHEGRATAAEIVELREPAFAGAAPRGTW